MKHKPKNKTKNMSTKAHAEVRIVTPEWAREILEKHEKDIADGKFRQRPINDRTVKRYAVDMKSGNWGLTGQGISFDEEKNLLDGQHRLFAVVMAGIPVQMLVTWDLPKENDKVKTINLFDLGRARSAGSQLKMDGVEYYNEIGGGARCLLMLSQGNIKGNFSVPQVIAVSELVKNNMLNLIEILGKGNMKHKCRGFILAPLTLLSTSDPDTAQLFATDFNEMANLGKTSPVLHFARFLERPTHVKGGTDYQLLAMKALSSALFFYTNEKKIEQRITGNDEHLEWLLKVSKNAVGKIREVAGINLTMDELKAK